MMLREKVFLLLGSFSAKPHVESRFESPPVSIFDL
jgi:hypothetical protein